MAHDSTLRQIPHLHGMSGGLHEIALNVAGVVANGTSSADLSALTQYGVLGAFAILLIGFARTAYKRETDRSDRLEAEVLRLNELIRDKCIPALGAATRALEESQELLHDLQRERAGRREG